MTGRSRELFDFPTRLRRRVEADFGGGDVSSDGGALLIRQADRRTGLLAAVAKAIEDPPVGGRCAHSQVSLLRQRVYGICLGHEDLNDHDTPRGDALLQTSVERADTGERATLCRLENRMDRDAAWAILSTLIRALAAALLVSVLSAPAGADDTVLEVIPLKHRTVDQVLPVIRPLVELRGSVSGMAGQLIVRTTPANLEEIRRVLAAIDTLPRRLVITVRQDGDRDLSRREAEVSGRLTIGGSAGIPLPPAGGDNTGLTVEGRSGDDRVRGRIADTRSLESDRDTQTLQVLEGSEAFITVGQSVPVPERRVVRTPYGAQVIDSTGYRSVGTGFYVLPRVSGDQVTLQINPQRERLSRERRGTIETQQLVTTVSGRLGEWMEIGGLGETRAESGSAVGSRSGASTVDQRRVLIKVEEIR